LGILLCCALLL